MAPTGGAYPGGRLPSPASIVGAHAQPPKSAAGAAMVSCPNCGGQTPAGFAFCQQCGGKLAPAPAHGPPAGVVSGQMGGRSAPEAIAATLAAQGPGEVAALLHAQPAPQPGYRPPPAAMDRDTAAEQVAAWGTLISVQRDGTDGDRYPLSGEWIDIGRKDAHIPFDDDQFLARRHARLEYGDRGVRVLPLDDLNGVYRRVDGPVALDDGATILIGREVLRFERLAPEERDVVALVRHGVALFGSPPRQPWGRLLLLLPNAGVRDIRYLERDEVVIGREEGEMVFRDDAFLSRRHVALRWAGGHCTLEDLKSSNGTFLRLLGPTDLRSGDHLRLGDQLFRFELGSAGR
jgi:pSer/pThr/pTyr-binding forkhead associated (FHA) protein